MAENAQIQKARFFPSSLRDSIMKGDEPYDCDLHGYTCDMARDLLQQAFSGELPSKVVYTFALGRGRHSRQKYHVELSKACCEGLVAAGLLEDRHASNGDVGRFKCIAVDDPDACRIRVFPKLLHTIGKTRSPTTKRGKQGTVTVADADSDLKAAALIRSVVEPLRDACLEKLSISALIACLSELLPMLDEGINGLQLLRSGTAPTPLQDHAAASIDNLKERWRLAFGRLRGELHLAADLSQEEKSCCFQLAAVMEASRNKPSEASLRDFRTLIDSKAERRNADPALAKLRESLRVITTRLEKTEDIVTRWECGRHMFKSVSEQKRTITRYEKLKEQVADLNAQLEQGSASVAYDAKPTSSVVATASRSASAGRLATTPRSSVSTKRRSASVGRQAATVARPCPGASFPAWNRPTLPTDSVAESLCVQEKHGGLTTKTSLLSNNCDVNTFSGTIGYVNKDAPSSNVRQFRQETNDPVPRRCGEPAAIKSCLKKSNNQPSSQLANAATSQPIGTTSSPRSCAMVALREFNSEGWGCEYLSLRHNDLIWSDGRRQEGWAFGELQANSTQKKSGWYPPDFVRALEVNVALLNWDAREYGSGYLSLNNDDEVWDWGLLEGGWAFGTVRRNGGVCSGWYPPAYVGPKSNPVAVAPIDIRKQPKSGSELDANRRPNFSTNGLARTVENAAVVGPTGSGKGSSDSRTAKGIVTFQNPTRGNTESARPPPPPQPQASPPRPKYEQRNRVVDDAGPLAGERPGAVPDDEGVDRRIADLEAEIARLRNQLQQSQAEGSWQVVCGRGRRGRGGA